MLQVMVIIRRENWLARSVSSAELFMDKSEETRVLGSQARIDAMYDYFRHFSREEVSPNWAERLARKAGEEIDEGLPPLPVCLSVSLPLPLPLPYSLEKPSPPSFASLPPSIGCCYCRSPLKVYE